MTEAISITEADGHQKAWVESAKSMTAEKLPEFIRHLIEDYHHDYGTICHAIAAAAVAAANAIEKSPQGGITGFQGGAVFWEFARGWGLPSLGECGARLVNMDDLLFPQYENKFNSISSDTWGLIQSKAKQQLTDAGDNIAPRVREHWESIAGGKVPFGLAVSA